MKAGPLQVAVEAAAQAAIGREHQQRGVAEPFRAFPAADGCTSRPLASRSCTSFVMRFVYAVAADARSIAFLNRAVAINSIVRVILRMLRIEWRRLSSTRGLAIGEGSGYGGQGSGMSGVSYTATVSRCASRPALLFSRLAGGVLRLGIP